MTRTALRAAIVAAVLASPAIAAAQATLRPTRPPIVTAENERWYLVGEPVMFAGNIYYPAGPLVFFNGDEMVRSGDYRGIPLYTRTTIEPYSLVFVPVGQGLMHPYERRRAGDVAGTVGSTVPSFPVTRPSEESGDVWLQAAAPPMLGTPLLGVEESAAAGSYVSLSRGGAVAEPPRPPVLRRPSSLNAVFIEFRGRRFLSRGPAVLFDPARFVQAGEYQGFPVYTEAGGSETTVYLPVARTAPDFVTPYSIR